MTVNVNAFRREHSALIDGSYEEKLEDSDHIYAFVRENKDEKLLTIANFSGNTLDFDCKAAGIEDEKTAEILVTNYENYKSESAGSSETEAELGKLRPWETLIIRCK